MTGEKIKPRITFDLDGKDIGASTQGVYMPGLRDVEGTFSGSLDLLGDHPLWTAPVEGRPITFYAPVETNRLMDLFYRLRERLLGIPYPTEPVFRGVIESVSERPASEGETAFDVTFTEAPQ